MRGLICRNKARGVTLSVIFLARTCEAKRYCSRPTNCISELGQRGVGMQGLVRGYGYILQAIARGSPGEVDVGAHDAVHGVAVGRQAAGTEVLWGEWDEGRRDRGRIDPNQMLVWV